MEDLRQVNEWKNIAQRSLAISECSRRRNVGNADLDYVGDEKALRATPITNPASISTAMSPPNRIIRQSMSRRDVKPKGRKERPQEKDEQPKVEGSKEGEEKNPDYISTTTSTSSLGAASSAPPLPPPVQGQPLPPVLGQGQPLPPVQGQPLPPLVQGQPLPPVLGQGQPLPPVQGQLPPLQPLTPPQPLMTAVSSTGPASSMTTASKPKDEDKDKDKEGKNHDYASTTSSTSSTTATSSSTKSSSTTTASSTTAFSSSTTAASSTSIATSTPTTTLTISSSRTLATAQAVNDPLPNPSATALPQGGISSMIEVSSLRQLAQDKAFQAGVLAVVLGVFAFLGMILITMLSLRRCRKKRAAKKQLAFEKSEKSLQRSSSPGSGIGSDVWKATPATEYAPVPSNCQQYKPFSRTVGDRVSRIWGGSQISTQAPPSKYGLNAPIDYLAHPMPGIPDVYVGIGNQVRLANRPILGRNFPSDPGYIGTEEQFRLANRPIMARTSPSYSGSMDRERFDRGREATQSPSNYKATVARSAPERDNRYWEGSEASSATLSEFGLNQPIPGYPPTEYETAPPTQLRIPNGRSGLSQEFVAPPMAYLASDTSSVIRERQDRVRDEIEQLDIMRASIPRAPTEDFNNRQSMLTSVSVPRFRTRESWVADQAARYERATGHRNINQFQFWT